MHQESRFVLALGALDYGDGHGLPAKAAETRNRGRQSFLAVLRTGKSRASDGNSGGE